MKDVLAGWEGWAGLVMMDYYWATGLALWVWLLLDCRTASLVWEAPKWRRNTAAVMSALQFKPMPSRLEGVLGGGREDLFWPNVPDWLDPCVCVCVGGECCADTMHW